MKSKTEFIVKTQKQLDAACKKQEKNAAIRIIIQCPADVILELRGSSHAELWGSSHAELWGSSHAELWGSSHAELWGSSHAVLRESSHAVLWESSHAVARDRCIIKASPQASIAIHGDTPSITGGVQIKYKTPSTAEEWCANYGAEVKDGIATLFKAVTDDYKSGYKFLYTPGTSPKAPDWDGGKRECGGGLHFCAHPLDAKGYHDSATKFVACPVRLTDIAVHINADYPNKVKAAGICAPIWECDRYGKPLAAGVSA